MTSDEEIKERLKNFESPNKQEIEELEKFYNKSYLILSVLSIITTGIYILISPKLYTKDFFRYTSITSLGQGYINSETGDIKFNIDNKNTDYEIDIYNSLETSYISNTLSYQKYTLNLNDSVYILNSIYGKNKIEYRFLNQYNDYGYGMLFETRNKGD